MSWRRFDVGSTTTKTSRGDSRNGRQDRSTTSGWRRMTMAGTWHQDGDEWHQDNEDDGRSTTERRRVTSRRRSRRQEQDVMMSAGAWRQDGEDNGRNKTTGRRQEHDIKTTKSTAGTRRQDVGRSVMSRRRRRRQEQDVRTSAVAWRQDDESLEATFFFSYQVVVRVSSRSPGCGLFNTKRYFKYQTSCWTLLSRLSTEQWIVA